MPILEVVLEQQYYNQQIINRWNYLASGTPASVSYSFGLASAFGGIEDGGSYPADTVITRLAGMQNTAMSFVQIGVKNVYDPVDFYENPFIPALSGTLTGEGMSPVMAIGFRTNRTRTDIRRATKRFAGIGVANVDPGGVIDPSFVTGAVDPLRTVMSAVLSYDDEGNTLTYQPIVVSKEKYNPDPLEPDKFAYRYYGTEAEQLDHIMTSIIWESYDTIRTQGSRQYGRGA